jgi:hypothetical protein
MIEGEYVIYRGTSILRILSDNTLVCGPSGRFASGVFLLLGTHMHSIPYRQYIHLAKLQCLIFSPAIVS